MNRFLARVVARRDAEHDERMSSPALALVPTLPATPRATRAGYQSGRQVRDWVLSLRRVTVEDVVVRYDVSRDAAASTLQRMAREGVVRRLSPGQYEVVQ